ncbi:MAG: Bromodomain-containing protein, partial [Piptocephalis tieghemiana]
FLKPVDPKVVPDYETVVKEPMDLSTMRSKVLEGVYRGIEEFKEDVYRICKNATLYNPAGSLYVRNANKL